MSKSCSPNIAGGFRPHLAATQKHVIKSQSSFSFEISSCGVSYSEVIVQSFALHRASRRICALLTLPSSKGCIRGVLKLDRRRADQPCNMVKRAKTGAHAKHVTDIPCSRPADCLTVAADTEECLPASNSADAATASTSGLGDSSAGQEGARPVRIYADGRPPRTTVSAKQKSASPVIRF